MTARVVAIIAVLTLGVSLAGCNIAGSPVGGLDAVYEEGGGARVVGWGIDPDAPDQAAVVRLYVNGEPTLDVSASKDRPDVDTGIPDSGSAHGFDAIVPLGSKSTSDVCAFVVNVGDGGPMTLLGCSKIVRGTKDPLGDVERTTLEGNELHFAGWALDPDVTAPILVQVTVNDNPHHAVAADLARPEIELFFPGKGPHHGFEIIMPDDGGLVAPTYCFYAVDHVDASRRVPLGCRTRPVDLVDVAGLSVASAISDNVGALVFTAGTQGINLSGDGYRPPERQIAFRRQNCGTSPYAIWDMPSGQCSPPTARPGRSLHERGLAIDFRCSGNGISSRSSPCYKWLAAHAASFGLYNLPSEPWHWSVNGN